MLDAVRDLQYRQGAQKLQQKTTFLKFLVIAYPHF